MVCFVLAMLLQASLPTGPTGPTGLTGPIRTIGKGPMSGVDAARQVTMHTAAEWATLWRAHEPNGKPPAVDFSKEMVVGVFLGARPTAGYGVEIVGTVVSNGALVVDYVETSPSRDAITAQILTAPYHLVAIAKRDGEVRFQKVEK